MAVEPEDWGIRVDFPEPDPDGGVYAVYYYYDAQDNLLPPDRIGGAVRFHGAVYDAQDEAISSVSGVCGKR